MRLKIRAELVGGGDLLYSFRRLRQVIRPRSWTIARTLGCRVRIPLGDICPGFSVSSYEGKGLVMVLNSPFKEVLPLVRLGICKSSTTGEANTRIRLSGSTKYCFVWSAFSEECWGKLTQNWAGRCFQTAETKLVCGLTHWALEQYTYPTFLGRGPEKSRKRAALLSAEVSFCVVVV